MAFPAPLSRLNWTWIHTTGPAPIELSFDIGIDAISLPLLLCCTATIVWVLCLSMRQTASAGFAMICGIVLSLAVLLVSNNVFQILLCWWLIALCGQGFSLLSAHASSSAAFVSKLRSWLIVEMLSVIVLLMGLAFCWMQFQTFSIPELNRLAADLLNPAARAVITTIGYCIVFAVLIRSAQFPFNGWIASLSHHTGSGQSTEIMPHSSEQPAYLGVAESAPAIWFGVIMPGSLVLLIRMLPLLQFDVPLVTTAVYLSLLSASLSVLIAINTTSWREVLCHLCVAQLALVITGLLSTATITQTASYFLMLVHILAFALLWIGLNQVVQRYSRNTTDSQNTPIRSVGITDLLLIILSLLWLSGFGGQNTIIATVQFPATPQGLETPSRPASGVNLLPILLTILVCLMSFAWVRIGLLVRRGESAEQFTQQGQTVDSDQTMQNGLLNLSLLVTIGLLFVVLVGLAFKPQQIEQYLASYLPAQSSLQGIVNLESGTVAALAGLVVAWLFYHQANPWPERIGHWFGPLMRLAHNQFYIHDAIHYGINLPVRTVALLMRFLEWVLIDQVVLRSLSGVMKLMTRIARPLQSGQLQLYLLSIVLSIVVLLMVMLGD